MGGLELNTMTSPLWDMGASSIDNPMVVFLSHTSSLFPLVFVKE